MRDQSPTAGGKGQLPKAPFDRKQDEESPDERARLEEDAVKEDPEGHTDDPLPPPTPPAG